MSLDEIRRIDRRAQGLTEETEKELLDYANAHKTVTGTTEAPVIVVELPYSKCAPITDVMYPEYTTLVCRGQDGEINIYSTEDVINSVSKGFSELGGWAGAGKFGHNFYGACNLTEEQMDKITDAAINTTNSLAHQKTSVRDKINFLSNKPESSSSLNIQNLQHKDIPTFGEDR